jgi:hypothetical protein
MSIFALQTNQIMLLAGIGLILFVFVNRLRRGFVTNERPISRHRPSSAGPRRPADTRPGDNIGSSRLRSLAASKDHEAWEVELHRLGREIKGEINTKLSALSRLIQTADEARMQLQAAIDRAESLGLIEDGNCAAAGGRRRTEGKPRRIAGVSSADPATAAGRSAPESNPGHPPAHRDITEGDFDSRTDDPRFDRVYALADAGFSAARIASQIGSQVGEVELILSLRRAA